MAEWRFNMPTIERLPDDPQVQAHLDRIAAAGEAAAHRACPRDTGHLASTIGTVRKGSGRRVLYGNDGDAWYAPLIEWGTRPHAIVPVRASVLRWEDATGVHYARRVWHPGTRPYRVMSGAALGAARAAAQ
jgi:hypothetical protein